MYINIIITFAQLEMEQRTTQLYTILHNRPVQMYKYPTYAKRRKLVSRCRLLPTNIGNHTMFGNWMQNRMLHWQTSSDQPLQQCITTVGYINEPW